MWIDIYLGHELSGALHCSARGSGHTGIQVNHDVQEVQQQK